ncbi:MAG: hypothetical protein K0R87_1327 [Pseudonocardia sp.]|nr:hypothetical protein [Pseudonocardia sp.]
MPGADRVIITLITRSKGCRHALPLGNVPFLGLIDVRG